MRVFEKFFKAGCICLNSWGEIEIDNITEEGLNGKRRT